MELLMSLQHYIRQLRPRDESYKDHVRKIQNLRELTVSPDYQSRGTFNPFYVLNVPEDDIKSAVGKGKIKYKTFPSIKKAYQKALFDINQSNISLKKVILFSPCSASFDEFKNFEDRGEKFIQMVNELK